MIALITCDALPALYEDDHLLVAALDELGVASRPVVWSDPAIDWAGFDAIVIRSPWDYFVRLAEFRAWLDARIASGAPMINDAAILEWNFDKRYLDDLAAAGVAMIPTIVVPRGELPDVAALARDRGWDDVVVKPTISGGAYRLHRFRVAEADQHRAELARTLEDRGLLIQPFLPEIEADGEVSMMLFDGEPSHAVRKRPKPGEFRVQFQYGGTTEPLEPAPAWVDAARTCVAAAPSLPTYARVDGVIVDGAFLLMELEVFEPVMYLARDPRAAARFARAITARLRRR